MKSTSPKSSPQGEDFVGLQNELKIPLHADAVPEIFERAKKLRADTTRAEQVLWEQLRAKRFMNLKFRRQHPLHSFIVDFYCHQLKLIVEADGGYHNEPEQHKLDKSRTAELENLGFTVARFMNEEIVQNTEETLKKLEEVILSLKDTSLKSSPAREDLKDIPLSSRRGTGRGDYGDNP